MLITFSGLDGSGKSTLIAWLRTVLEQQHRPVTVFHMNDHVGVYAYARAFRDRLVGAQRPGPNGGAPAQRPPSAGAPQSPVGGGLKPMIRRVRNAILWNKPLRRLIYPLDLLVFLGYRLYVERVRKRILIMDRYFYDTLVDVSDGRHWAWIRLLKRLTPTPQLAVLLDISPEEAYGRKGEYSVEYLRRRWEAYRTVFPWVRSGVRLANDDLERAKAVLSTALHQRLGRANGDES